MQLTLAGPHFPAVRAASEARARWRSRSPKPRPRNEPTPSFTKSRRRMPSQLWDGPRSDMPSARLILSPKASMVEDKLGGVDQGPHDVLNGGLAVRFVRRERRGRDFHPVVAWKPR